MPRVSGIYSRPTGIDAVANNTIDSGKYNSNVADVEADLNLPRPIVAGGTGASNATEARDNLDAERAMAQVVNYSLHVFENGSFWSDNTAIGSPAAGHTFSGTAIVTNNDQNYIQLSAFDVTDTVTPGRTWRREKRAGAWSAWQPGGTTPGTVTITGGSPTLILDRPDTSTQNAIVGNTAGIPRWAVILGDASAASDFQIARFSDGGVLADRPLTIARANGAVDIPNTLSCSIFNCTGSASFAGLSCSTLTATGNITTAGFVQTVNSTQFGGSANSGIFTNGITLAIRGFANNDVVIQNAGGSVTMLSCGGGGITGTGYKSKNGISGTAGASQFNTHWLSPAHLWVDATDLGAITLSSDYRIKKDVLNLPGMWETVKALRPVKYTQAQYTPQAEIARKLEQARADRAAGMDTPAAKAGSEFVPMFAADDVERWGFIAHELQQTFLPSAASGVKDQPDAIQSLNLAPVVAALTKALQEAQIRIETLEATVGTTPTTTILQRLDVLDKFREKIEAL